MSAIIDWIVSLMDTLGAPGVGIAILLENLFPPIPSEAVSYTHLTLPTSDLV